MGGVQVGLAFSLRDPRLGLTGGVRNLQRRQFYHLPLIVMTNLMSDAERGASRVLASAIALIENYDKVHKVV